MINFKTSYLQANVPPKVLTGNITSISGYDRWDSPNGSDDPWWKDGSRRQYYQWEVDVDIEVTSHGSHLTRKPFEYNSYDVNVGDYIASSDGIVLKVVSVQFKNNTSVTMVVEDYLRFNTFLSSIGDGSIPKGECVIFQIGDDGEPLLANLPQGFANSDFVGKVNSYFNYLNPLENYLIKQLDHGFVVGQILSIANDGTYVKTNNSNYNRMVGNVVQTMGDDYFILKTVNKIVDYKPAMPGQPGDLLYADNNGSVTTDKTPKLLFIKLAEAVPSRAISRNESPSLTNGDKLVINNELIATTDGTVSGLVDSINYNGSDDYTANFVPQPTVMKSTGTLPYGLVGGFIPFSASINGVLVTFDDDSSGASRYGAGIADEYDITDAINAANIPNISASVYGSYVSITETQGGPITIENQDNDVNNTPFAGSASCTGLPLSVTESESQSISINRLDGGVLYFENGESNTGDIISELGIVDTFNGSYPVVLYVEQGIRKGEVYTLDNDSQRLNLDVLPGDSAYVMDSGNGEWAYWLYTTDGWSKIATQDSSRTDADTLDLDVRYFHSGTLEIGTVSDGSRVSNISVKVIETFDGVPVMNVGDTEVNDRLIRDDVIDLTEPGTYTFTPSHVYNTGSDTDLFVYFDPGSSTKGHAQVIITYS